MRKDETLKKFHGLELAVGIIMATPTKVNEAVRLAFVDVKTNKLVVNAVFNKKRGIIASVESGHQTSKIGEENLEGQDKVQKEQNDTKQILQVPLITTTVQVT